MYVYMYAFSFNLHASTSTITKAKTKDRIQPGADLGFAKGRGAYHGKRVEREPITGIWGQTAGSRGRWGSGDEEAESFSSIFLQKEPTV